MKHILFLIACYLSLGVIVITIISTIKGKSGLAFIPFLLINPVGWLLLLLWPVYSLAFLIIGDSFVL